MKIHLLTEGIYSQIMTIGTACTMVSINPKFRSPQWRSFRATMFVAMGLSAVFPVLHGVSKYGVSHLNQAMGLRWVVLQGFLYVLGAFIYAVSALFHPSIHPSLPLNLFSFPSLPSPLTSTLSWRKEKKKKRGEGGKDKRGKKNRTLSDILWPVP